jgi:hypothetical protein
MVTDLLEDLAVALGLVVDQQDLVQEDSVPQDKEIQVEQADGRPQVT